MICPFCLEQMHYLKTDYEIGSYYCTNNRCEYYPLLVIHENNRNILSYIFRTNNKLYEIIGKLSEYRYPKATSLYCDDKLIVMVPFIDISLNNVRSDVENLINKLMKLVAFS